MPAGARSSAAADLPTLTSLRCLAALAVFGWHTDTHGWTADLLRPGPSGVSFFYVLSGFVLVWSARPDDTARRFWARRWARIYPAHLVAWCVAFALFGGTALPFLAGAFLVQSWIPDQTYFFGGNGVAWSLSCEAFFYLAFPLLHRTIRTWSARRLRLTVAATTAAVTAVDLAALALATPTDLRGQRGVWIWLAYVFPPVRFGEFVLGCCTALLLRSSTTWVGRRHAALLALAAYAATDLAPMPNVTAFVTALPFALLIGACARSDVDGRPSRWHARWLVTLGRWSFCFYLVHQLALRRAHELVHTQTAATALGFALALAATIALHYAVERPCERAVRRRLTRTRPQLVSG